MECMANSDNVIRAGLTPKLRDVPNLVATLTYSAAAPTKHRVTPVAFRGTAHSALYDPPIPEFAVVRTALAPGAAEAHPPLAGPSIAIFAQGAGRVLWDGGALEAGEGSVLFVGAGTAVEVRAADDAGATLFRAFVEA
jgi:mannose-6-phosphate isomerase